MYRLMKIFLVVYVHCKVRCINYMHTNNYCVWCQSESTTGSYSLAPLASRLGNTWELTNDPDLLARMYLMQMYRTDWEALILKIFQELSSENNFQAQRSERTLNSTRKWVSSQENGRHGERSPGQVTNVTFCFISMRFSPSYSFLFHTIYANHSFPSFYSSQ